MTVDALLLHALVAGRALVGPDELDALVEADAVRVGARPRPVPSLKDAIDADDGPSSKALDDERKAAAALALCAGPETARGARGSRWKRDDGMTRSLRRQARRALAVERLDSQRARTGCKRWLAKLARRAWTTCA